MKTSRINSQADSATYAVLIRSEHEERSLAEAAVYLLFILSAVFSIWQVAHQPITLPLDSATERASIAQAVSGQHHGV